MYTNIDSRYVQKNFDFYILDKSIHLYMTLCNYIKFVLFS